MQNTYQEKIGDLEANKALVRKKLEGGIKFKIKSSFQPAGDQPEAIKKILKNLKEKIILNILQRKSQLELGENK